MKRLSDNLRLRTKSLLLMCSLLILVPLLVLYWHAKRILVKQASLLSEGPEITHDDLPMEFGLLIFLPSLPY